MEIILWNFSMFYHIFFSLGMRQSAFISNKQGVYELPHKLLRELRFRILGNKKKSGKSQYFQNYKLVPSLSVKTKFFQYQPKTTEKQKLNPSRKALLHVKTKVSLKYLLNDCLWKHSFTANSPQIPSNLIWLTILVTLMPFTQFQPKIRATKFYKCPKNCLTW